MNQVVCPHCKTAVPRGNFCSLCKAKLVTVCDCWKTGGKFNCGLPNCSTDSLPFLSNNYGRPSSPEGIIQQGFRNRNCTHNYSYQPMQPKLSATIVPKHRELSYLLLELLGDEGLTHDEVRFILESCLKLVSRSIFSGVIKNSPQT